MLSQIHNKKEIPYNTSSFSRSDSRNLKTLDRSEGAGGLGTTSGGRIRSLIFFTYRVKKSHRKSLHGNNDKRTV